jgi:hypothetical protein
MVVLYLSRPRKGFAFDLVIHLYPTFIGFEEDLENLTGILTGHGGLDPHTIIADIRRRSEKDILPSLE